MERWGSGGGASLSLTPLPRLYILFEEATGWEGSSDTTCQPSTLALWRSPLDDSYAGGVGGTAAVVVVRGRARWQPRPSK